MTHASTNAQVDLYGATWATRFQALRSAYGLSQRSLAATVGLSAPMVSQLVSGQRVKISNPSVLARIVRLEECLSDPEVVAGDHGAIALKLRQIGTVRYADAAKRPVKTVLLERIADDHGKFLCERAHNP